MAEVVVLKLGVGNIYSVKTGLERTGLRVRVEEDLSRLGNPGGVVLPGVGSARAASRRLGPRFADRLKSLGAPVLGICLGMQLLFEESEEGGRGLGILPGRIVRLRASKLPHMGWSRIWITSGSTLLDGVRNGSYFYFAHSYAYTGSGGFVRAVSTYEDVRFAAVVERHPFYGTQFHPERSGADGLRVLENYAGLVGGRL